MTRVVGFTSDMMQLADEIRRLQAQLQAEVQERRTAEASLNASEQRLRKIFNHSNDAIFVFDPESDRILEANPCAAHMLGYDREELLNVIQVSSIHPGEMPKMRKFAKHVLSEGTGWTNELTCFTKSGNRIPSEISASVLPFEGRQCIVALVRDITERKVAEDRLRCSEARFRTFVENTADALFLITTDGHITDVNRRACEYLGYSRHALLQMQVTDIEVGQSAAEISRLMQSLQKEQSVVVEGVHRRQDGTTFPIELNLCLFDAGNCLQVLAAARDITERKQAEATRARLAEIGELAAMIVHEVRSPLTTVLMGLESFQQMDLSERAQMRLSLALSEADRLKELLNEILQYAREQVLTLEEIDLSAMMHDLHPTVAELPQASERQIRLETPNAGVWVEGDRNKLKQVFINLVSNACEAVDAGAVVTWRINQPLAARHSHNQPDKPSLAHQVAVSIHNGGDPIPPEVLPKLGTPFFTTKPGGNGLGLALVNRIVEAHDGEFFIESDEAMGTVVTVTLPRLQRE